MLHYVTSLSRLAWHNHRTRTLNINHFQTYAVDIPGHDICFGACVLTILTIVVVCFDFFFIFY